LNQQAAIPAATISSGWRRQIRSDSFQPAKTLLDAFPSLQTP